jgi:hypothetical protein
VIVRVKISALRQGAWHEYLTRFILGGVATLLAGAVAGKFGPETGGLFLAFPAIFCASATLIEGHERRRKHAKGLAGEVRGKNAAALDAAGAGLGSVALASFGLAIFLFANQGAAVSLLLAMAAWLVTALLLWSARRHLRYVRASRRPA